MLPDSLKKNAEIEMIKDRARVEYPHLWHKMIIDWRNAEQEDALWLSYSANYLFNTAEIKWAMDPFSLFSRIGGGIQPDFVHDLDRLQLVVLTHMHNDHLDINLLSAIQPLKITWVIPEFLLKTISKNMDLPKERILVPQIGCPIRFGGLTLHPLAGLHFNNGRGVPEMGYLVEFNNKRWLFPGDTRQYDQRQMSDLCDVTGVFAHLWLGKACALQDFPPLLEDFCQFFLAPKPERIVVTHLQELGRTAEDYWDLDHFQKVSKVWKKLAPSISVKAALMGQKVLL